MENETDKERVVELIPAWRANQPPRFAGECNAIFQLADAHDARNRPFWIYGKVTWNGVSERYEIEPMIRDASGVFTIAEMNLTPSRFCDLIEVLEVIGIRHWHRIYDRTQPRAERPTTLPASIFPRLVHE